MPPVQRIEMVRQVDFYEVPADPMWRVEVSGICADFPTETWANNFRNAILALTPAVAPDGAGEEGRAAVPKGFKPVYVKQWRTLIIVSEAHADKVRAALSHNGTRQET